MQLSFFKIFVSQVSQVSESSSVFATVLPTRLQGARPQLAVTSDLVISVPGTTTLLLSWKPILQGLICMPCDVTSVVTWLLPAAGRRWMLRGGRGGATQAAQWGNHWMVTFCLISSRGNRVMPWLRPAEFLEVLILVLKPCPQRTFYFLCLPLKSTLPFEP